MRKHPKLDSNHSVIVNALRQAGCSVQSLASVGGGCPDLLVGTPQRYNLNTPRQNWLLEVKDGSKPPSRRAMTPDELAWQSSWRGQVCTVTSVDEALKAVGIV